MLHAESVRRGRLVGETITAFWPRQDPTWGTQSARDVGGDDRAGLTDNPIQSYARRVRGGMGVQILGSAWLSRARACADPDDGVALRAAGSVSYG